MNQQISGKLQQSTLKNRRDERIIWHLHKRALTFAGDSWSQRITCLDHNLLPWNLTRHVGPLAASSNLIPIHPIETRMFSDVIGIRRKCVSERLYLYSRKNASQYWRTIIRLPSPIFPLEPKHHTMCQRPCSCHSHCMYAPLQAMQSTCSWAAPHSCMLGRCRTRRWPGH